MSYILSPLPYAFDALEPYIDARTLEIHHDKHHATYLNNLNKALESCPDLQAWHAEDLLKELHAVPENIRTAVRNSGGGFVNHNFYWESMAPQAGGEPPVGSPLAVAIQDSFGSFASFKEKFSDGDHFLWAGIPNQFILVQRIESADVNAHISAGMRPFEAVYLNIF